MTHQKIINELYDFIVSSDLEHSIISQCKDEYTKELLKEWFDVE